jgi:AcrR family transcriptional regulator
MEAARRLFMERGYTGATIAAIALEAKVSPETVYVIFGSKRALLADLVGMSVLGDAKPVPLLEQEGPRATRRSKSQHDQVLLFAADMRQIMSRVGPLFQIMHTAAATEPEIAVLLGQLLEQRLHWLLTVDRGWSGQRLRNGWRICSRRSCFLRKVRPEGSVRA